MLFTCSAVALTSLGCDRGPTGHGSKAALDEEIATSSAAEAAADWEHGRLDGITTREVAKPAPPKLAPLDPPPFAKNIFPCSDCHAEQETNPEPRQLTEKHQKIALNHSEGRWCLDCHAAQDRDKLRLVNGTLVPFEETHRLCGQCHAGVVRDFSRGLHGKRIGRWNGERRYHLCAHCHDAHSPRFPPLHPEPPPTRPEDIR